MRLKTFLVLFLEFTLTLVGIILLGNLPYLLFEMDAMKVIQEMLDTGQLRNAQYLVFYIDFYWREYGLALVETVKQLVHFMDLTYYQPGNFYDEGKDVPLFPEMWHTYFYSVKVLGASFMLSIFLSAAITYIIMMFTNMRVRKSLSSFFSVFQIVPDVFLILFFQFLIVQIYKKTDVLLFNILSFNGDNAYGLPIICMTVLPTVFLTKILLNLYEDALEQRYVETAKAKGVRRSGLLIRHIFRNTVVSMFHNIKTLFWFSLSNLLMVEVLFNINGVTYFMWTYGIISPQVFIVGMILFFLPFYLIFVLGGLIASKYSTAQEEVFV